jgi:hypothetical protein
MTYNKVFILTDKKDDGYNSFLFRLGEISIKSSFDIVELDQAGFKVECVKDYIIIPGIFTLFSSNSKWIDKTVKSIRKNTETALFPILIFSDTYENEDHVSDSIIKIPFMDQILKSEIEKYFYMVDDINTFNYIVKGSDIVREKLLILLRFLVSRNIKIIEPKKSHVYPFYYNYPLAGILLDANSGEEIEKLELLNKMKLLNGIIADKMFICPHCKNINIGLNEFCPKCNSIDMQITNAVTHRKCGFCSLEEDFIKVETGILKCPKCNIKFSYNSDECEKFEAALCNSCGNIFKKPTYSFNCLNCGKVITRDQITTREINKYYLTSDGVKAAESGSLFNFSTREAVLKSENNPVKDEIFKEILYLENIRSIRFKTVFCLAEVEFKGSDYSEFISTELSKILIRSLRVTDIYTQLEQGIFLILFLNCDADEVNLALNKIRNEVRSVLKDQIKTGWKIINKSGTRSSGTLPENKIIPARLDEVILKKEILEEKKPNTKTKIKNLEIERPVIKSISIKSIFNFFFFLYLIIFIFGVILYALIYYSGKKFGFISEEFQISLYITELSGRIGLDFLNYFNNPVMTTILYFIVGLLFSVVSGFLGFLLACITNLGLKISKGMELRFLKSKPEVKSLNKIR